MVIRRTIRWRVHFVEDNGAGRKRNREAEEDDDEEENEDDSRRTTKRSSHAGFATWTLAPSESFLSSNGWRVVNWNIWHFKVRSNSFRFSFFDNSSCSVLPLQEFFNFGVLLFGKSDLIWYRTFGLLNSVSVRLVNFVCSCRLLSRYYSAYFFFLVQLIFRIECSKISFLFYR